MQKYTSYFLNRIDMNLQGKLKKCARKFDSFSGLFAANSVGDGEVHMIPHNYRAM